MAIVGVIRSSSIERTDDEPNEQVQNPATIGDPGVVASTAVEQVDMSTSRDEKSDEGYYSPDSQDDSMHWREIQLAKRMLGDEEECSDAGGRDSGGYSSVSDEDEQRGLGGDTGHHATNSDDDSQIGCPATGAFKWVCTRPCSPPRTDMSEEDDNPDGDEHYVAADGTTHAYKWSLKNHKGDTVGVFERCQAHCWGCNG